MANSWLRLWHEFPNDPKWRTISRASGQSISCVIAVFVHVLVDASQNEKRGVTQCNAEDVAAALDLETESVELIFTAMQGRVLEGDRVSGWEKRQPMREDFSAERVKKWRERTVTQRNAPDKDKDKDKDEKHKKTSARSVPPEELAGTLPLVTGDAYPISKSQIKEWSDAYPGVDVKGELKKMKVWLDANPTRKKTPRGILRAVVGWLTRAQDDGRRTQNAGGPNGHVNGNGKNSAAVANANVQGALLDLGISPGPDSQGGWPAGVHAGESTREGDAPGVGSEPGAVLTFPTSRRV